MKATVIAALAVLLAAPVARSSDADAIAALRARIEEQAAQVEALRAELARLEAKLAAPASTPAPPPAAAPSYPTMRIAGLLQGWYMAGDEGFNDTFRIRRAEMRMSGELSKTVGWSVMIDPAKVLSISSGTINHASRPLQDAFLTVGGLGPSTFVVGQYRIPLSREGLEPAGALDTVERALFISDRARGGAYGDVRDIGVSLRGTLRKRLDYQLGVFNGSGESQNETDRNDRKSVAGRFVAGVTGNLRVGLSGAWAGPGDATVPRRDRLGGEVLFARGPLKLAAEYMTGRDGALDRRGYYAHAGYRFRPNLEGVVRVDTWDPDTARDDTPATDEETDYTIGFNYSPMAKLRFQFNAVHKAFSGNTPERNLLLANLQTSW